MDDLIEYLLARWPRQCASVVARLNEADLQEPGTCDSLEGIPAVWRVVLDRMAVDEQLVSPIEAILQKIERLLESPERLGILQDLCLVVAARRPLPETSSDLGRHSDEIIRLTSPRGILLKLAADSVIASLRGPSLPGCLLPTPPSEIIRQVSRQADFESFAKLRSIVEDASADKFHAAAVGILVSANPDWRPRKTKDLDLTLATLDGARWSGLDLRHARLASASLTNADLSEADLSLAAMSYVDLAFADLRSSCLAGVESMMANFSGADLTCADATSAAITIAKFENARLDGARLDYAKLTGSDLTGASFKGASLKFAELQAAVVNDADFSGADFEGAELDGVRFCESVIRGARFGGALMKHANLEFVDVGEYADFSKTSMTGALLTGAQLPKACFGEADLRMAGLADVNLEGADLRGADLTNATFHMGSSRSGLVDSPLASEGTRTGFYTDDYEEKHFMSPEEIRKANLSGADLTGAKIGDTDFYLVDLRGAVFDRKQRRHFERCGAILDCR